MTRKELGVEEERLADGEDLIPGSARREPLCVESKSLVLSMNGDWLARKPR